MIISPEEALAEGLTKLKLLPEVSARSLTMSEGYDTTWEQLHYGLAKCHNEYVHVS